MKKIFLVVAIGVVLTSYDDNKTPSYAVIRGTVTFDNVNLWSIWQDSGDVEITIFPDSAWASTPGGTFPIAAPVYVDTLIPNVALSTYPYELQVEPGTYSALAVGFRHNLVTDPSKRTATLGVYWGMPDSVSHGIIILGTPFNYPLPSSFTVQAGDELNIDFKADLAFVTVWPFR